MQTPDYFQVCFELNLSAPDELDAHFSLSRESDFRAVRKNGEFEAATHQQGDWVGDDGVDGGLQSPSICNASSMLN